MSRFAISALGFGLLAVMGVADATAQDRGVEAASARPALLESLLACRAISSADARLSCFDAATAAFETAERQGEVTVVDRAGAQETRARLFGLNLGSANLFGGLRLDAPIEAVETSLARASQDQNGKWIFVLQDGSTWRQVDTERMSPRPAAGQSVRIRQAAIGSYLLSVAGARSVRARREN